MALCALKLAICVLLFIAGASAFCEMEDGLCVIVTAKGRGTGFVVGDKFFSAAHVVKKVGEGFRIFCAQSGKLVEITDSVSPIPHLHKNYFNMPEGVDSSRNTLEQLQSHAMNEQWQYDLGYL